MAGISNDITIEKLINEDDDDDLKANFVGVFSSDKTFKFINFHALIKQKKGALSFYDYEYRQNW